MHELFLTAVVSNADFERTTAVLQGLCAMSAWQSVHRVLFFAGPPQPRGLPTVRSLVQSTAQLASQPPQPQPLSRLWQELHQHLSRQSYLLRTRYEVFRDHDFSNDSDEETNSSSGNTSGNR